jgi:TerC family integral membrane protein
LWMDVRAHREAEAVATSGDPALRVNGAGAGPVSPEWMIPKALWIARNQPDLWAAAAKVGEYQDYLNLRLTGEWCASLNNVTMLALVLMVGVVLSLVLRGAFILVGAALIESFSAIFYIFGAFLIYTAWHQAFRSAEDDEESESKLIVWLRKRIQVSKDYDGAKLRTIENGKKMFTPILVVFVAIAATDVMFAFDSIPAIFGITTDPFIVFTANVFALMGLRQLYFLLGALVDKLQYLKYGIAFILGFIGVKLVLHAMHENQLPFINGGQGLPVPEIDTTTSLVVIVASIVVSAALSVRSIQIGKRG